MSLTHTITQSWNRGSENLSAAVAISNQADIALDIDQAASQTNTQIGLVIDVSQLKVFYVLCDQDCTIKTNSSGSPDTTLSIKANKPFVWESSCGYFANPFVSTDVTTAYVTNTLACTLKIRALVDGTP